MAARKALEELGGDVVPELKETLRSPKVNARRSAIGALASLGPDAEDAIPQVVDLVEDPEVGTDAQNAVVAFGEDAVPVLVERLERPQITVLRQNVYRNLIVRMGPRGACAWKFSTCGRSRRSGALLAALQSQLPSPKLAPIVAPPPGQGGTIFADLRKQFNAWGNNRDHLTSNDLRRAFGGDSRLANRFLKQVDREGRGTINRQQYDRWALQHTERLVKEREAQAGRGGAARIAEEGRERDAARSGRGRPAR